MAFSFTIREPEFACRVQMCRPEPEAPMISPEPRPTRPLRGILFKLCSVLVFIVMASLIKATSAHVPAGQAVFFRSALAIPVIMVLLRWGRELATCDVEYYRWEQKIFLEMFSKGLAYKKTSFVNWCPTCETVLANEQVEDGSCWRCANEVKQKELDQWFFRITDYAEELLECTNTLSGWPERVLVMQRNWIGKSFGCEIDFALDGQAGTKKVFTTRQDTVFGATFMSIAPDPPLVC